MRPHELDQAIFDKMDQSPYTVQAHVGNTKFEGDHLISITAHHPDHENAIGGMMFKMPSGDMTSFEIHPDHRNGVVAAKMIEKAYTVCTRLGFKTAGLHPEGTFSPDSAKLMDKLFPKEDGTKHEAGLRKGFSFTYADGSNSAYGRSHSKYYTSRRCPACFGSHRLGLDPEDMSDPVKVTQGHKECPHCDEFGYWNGTDRN
jgi:hypothetical protein